MNSKGLIMVACPSYDFKVQTDFAGSLCIAAQHCFSRGVMVEPRFANGFTLVEYARNWLVAEFLASKATHLFWIDSDLYFPPDKIYKLFSRDLDVVAGVYTTKHPTDPIFPYQSIGDVKDGLQEATLVPGGFICMSRKAVEAVVKTCEWHDIDHNGVKRSSPRMFSLEVNHEGKLVGEDYVACERLRQAGFKIYVETDIDFVHYGMHAWRGNLSETLRLAHVSPGPTNSN